MLLCVVWRFVNWIVSVTTVYSVCQSLLLYLSLPSFLCLAQCLCHSLLHCYCSATLSSLSVSLSVFVNLSAFPLICRFSFTVFFYSLSLSLYLVCLLYGTGFNCSYYFLLPVVELALMGHDTEVDLFALLSKWGVKMCCGFRSGALSPCRDRFIFYTSPHLVLNSFGCTHTLTAKGYKIQMIQWDCSCWEFFYGKLGLNWFPLWAWRRSGQDPAYTVDKSLSMYFFWDPYCTTTSHAFNRLPCSSHFSLLPQTMTTMTPSILTATTRRASLSHCPKAITSEMGRPK